MSKELQEKADQVMQELKDALIPIRREIKILNKSRDKSGNRI